MKRRCLGPALVAGLSVGCGAFTGESGDALGVEREEDPDLIESVVVPF